MKSLFVFYELETNKKSSAVDSWPLHLRLVSDFKPLSNNRSHELDVVALVARQNQPFWIKVRHDLRLPSKNNSMNFAVEDDEDGIWKLHHELRLYLGSCGCKFYDSKQTKTDYFPQISYQMPADLSKPDIYLDSLSVGQIEDKKVLSRIILGRYLLGREV